MRGRRLASVCALALLVTLLSPAAARALVLPTGFSGVGRVDRAHQPDQHRVRRRRPRLRRREERHHQGLRQPGRPTPTVFADLRTQRPQLLGPRAARPGRSHPNFPADPYVYVLYTYDAAVGGTAPTLGRRLRRARRARPATAASSAGRLSRLTGRRQPDDRRRAGAHRGLVPAVPEPLDRRPGLRRRRRALRQRRRRRQLQLRRLRPGRQPAQPVRRPAGRGRRHPDAADGRGRRPAQPGPAHHRRPGRASTAPSSGSTRTPARPCPATRCRLQPTPTPAASSPTACATRSASPSGPAPARSGSATSAGAPGRRSTASPTRPTPRSTNFGWPCYEGTGRQGGYDGANLDHLREPVRGRRRRGHQPLLHLQPRASWSCPARPARPAARRSPGVAFYPAAGGTYPADYHGRAVLRRLLARLHLGDAGRRQRPARPGQPVAPSPPGAGNPVDLEIGPAPATSSTPTSRRRRDPPDPLLRRPTTRRRRSPRPPRPAARRR